MILHTNNYLNIIEIQEIVNFSSNKIELEGCVIILEDVIDSINKDTELYILFCHLLSVSYQKMIEKEYWFEKNVVEYLKKAIHYCHEIEKNYPKIKNNTELPNPYVATLEEANCLAKLADYENNEKYYEKAIKLYEKVIKNTNDEQTKYLAIMNKSKVQIFLSERNIKNFKEINKNLKKLNKITSALKDALKFFEQNKIFEEHYNICLENIKISKSICNSFNRYYFFIFMKYKPTQFEKINRFKKYKFEVYYD